MVGLFASNTPGARSGLHAGLLPVAVAQLLGGLGDSRWHTSRCVFTLLRFPATCSYSGPKTCLVWNSFGVTSFDIRPQGHLCRDMF